MRPGDAVNTVMYGLWLVVSVAITGKIIKITYITPERELATASWSSPGGKVGGRLFVTTEGPDNEYFSDANEIVRLE